MTVAPPYGLVPQPRGLVRVPAGTVLLRIHPATRPPTWFGPARGKFGTNRFDVVGPRAPEQRGILYAGYTMLGVVHEAVVRGADIPYLSRAGLNLRYHVSQSTVLRELCCIDLVLNTGASGLTTSQCTEDPDQLAVPPTPPYPTTQPWATHWERDTREGRWPNPRGAAVDGILYGSRFGSLNICLGLWEQDPNPLTWAPPTPLGDAPDVEATLQTLSIQLGP